MAFKIIDNLNRVFASDFVNELICAGLNVAVVKGEFLNNWDLRIAAVMVDRNFTEYDQLKAYWCDCTDIEAAVDDCSYYDSKIKPVVVELQRLGLKVCHG